MAGNIPPLVSSTPPPLNAFDDDEDEEEEDEFGLYNTAEDIDYNGCISYKEKDDETQNGSKSRCEQDSTSQDSATDSGLCPDSEEMSPVPHSDDERTLKQNSCSKTCQKADDLPEACVSELHNHRDFSSVNHGSVSGLSLPNGHTKEDLCEQESDDDFGNFEFAQSQKISRELNESLEEGVVSSNLSSSIHKFIPVEPNADNISNIQNHTDQHKEDISTGEQNLTEFRPFESNLSGTVDDALEETCKLELNSTHYSEITNEKLDVASSNDNSSFNSVESSAEPTSSQCPDVEQHDSAVIVKASDEVHEDGLMSTMENFDYREEKEIEIPVVNEDDEEFDDFTEFKAESAGCDGFSKCDQGDKSDEHSKISVEPTKFEDAALSLRPSLQEESDEEFSNFADFSSSDCAFVSAQSSNSLENVSHIPLKLDDSDLRTESDFQDWVSVFPCEDLESPLVASALLSQDDVVWSRLFPLESSPALSYQWNESLSNRHLLTALNIDSRNILFTAWSVSAVPRFAANLSRGPLEPTKAAEPAPTIPATSAPTPATITASATQETVPDAHFDWVSSGLTNPLDSCHSALLDLNFILTIETQLAICPKTVLNLPKILSSEAENILNSLPDISFMRKTYIDFPIGEA